MKRPREPGRRWKRPRKRRKTKSSKGRTKSSKGSKNPPRPRPKSVVGSWNQLRGIACAAKLRCSRQPPKGYKPLVFKPKSLRLSRTNSYEIEGDGEYFAPTLWKGYLVFKRTNNFSYSWSRVKTWLGLNKYKTKRRSDSPYRKLIMILDRFSVFVTEKLKSKFNYVLRLVKRVSQLLSDGKLAKLYVFLRKFIRPRRPS